LALPGFETLLSIIIVPPGVVWLITGAKLWMLNCAPCCDGWLAQDANPEDTNSNDTMRMIMDLGFPFIIQSILLLEQVFAVYLITLIKTMDGNTFY
jgi:hypothetical protein